MEWKRGGAQLTLLLVRGQSPVLLWFSAAPTTYVAIGSARPAAAVSSSEAPTASAFRDIGRQVRRVGSPGVLV